MSADTTSSPVSDVADAAERVRGTAKWTIGAFGAIGAAIAASLPFTDIGKLTDGARTWAIVGIALAYLAISVAIVAVARLLLPHATTLDEIEALDPNSSLQKLLDDEPSLLLPYSTVEELAQDVRQMEEAYRQAFLAWQREKTTQNANVMRAWVDASTVANGVRDRVITWSNYEKIFSDYRSAMSTRVLPGMLVAAVGIILFAVHVTKPAVAEPSALTGANVAQGSFQGIQLRGADLTGANFASVDLSAADLSGATLDGAVLTNANLTDVNLRGASLKGAKLERVIWSATTCPDGTNSDDVGGSCVAHLEASA